MEAVCGHRRQDKWPFGLLTMNTATSISSVVRAPRADTSLRISNSSGSTTVAAKSKCANRARRMAAVGTLATCVAPHAQPCRTSGELLFSMSANRFGALRRSHQVKDAGDRSEGHPVALGDWPH